MNKTTTLFDIDTARRDVVDSKQEADSWSDEAMRLVVEGFINPTGRLVHHDLFSAAASFRDLALREHDAAYDRLTDAAVRYVDQQLIDAGFDGLGIGHFGAKE